MPLGPNPGPENQTRGPFSEQQTDEPPTLARGDGGGRATVHNARIPRRFRAVSYEHATSLELSGRVHSIRHFFRKNPTGAIIPALMHRIPPELRSWA